MKLLLHFSSLLTMITPLLNTNWNIYCFLGKVFNESEKVLCFHGPLLYEGKILHIRKDLDSTGETFYRIHYNGWSKK